MFLFSDLLEAIAAYLEQEQVDAITQAYFLAESAHQGQTRASGEPYISHPLAVAHILATMHLDYESIIAAILHDVLEDTNVNKKMLTEKFGASVADLVDGVSKLNQMEFASRAEAQAESFRKMLLAMVRDIRVILVKLADRLHNMRTLTALTPEKRQRIAKETLEIYAPIANRLGMYKMRLELEDLGFKALYPGRYSTLQKSLYRSHGYRKDIVHNIQQAIHHRLQQNQFPHCAIYGREKHLYSIYKKMRAKHLHFSEIMDMYGFRVVVPTIDDCYRVVGVVHSLYKPLPGRFKDYIAMPKANNYQSLHTTLFGPHGVPIEVQIRTEEMDHIAENGIAAHWLYKNQVGDLETGQYTHTSPWLKSLEEMQSQAGNSLEFLENVKIDLFPEEVYVFTPKGRILELPAGATITDFAYAVHTDIGNACVAGKIDRQLVPLSTVLENGQTIEVVTSEDGRPSPAWLNFVVTGKARSHIRHFLKGQRRAESIELGKRLLEAALIPLELQLKTLPERILQQLAQESGLTSIESLYEEIGLSQRIATLEAQRIANLLGKKLQPVTAAAPISIKGTEGLMVQFATCCRPIPNDPIVGYLKPGTGLMIHRQDCPQILQRRAKIDESIPVEWEMPLAGEFSCELQVDMTNLRGMLALLAVGITDIGANIEDIKTGNRDGHHTQINLVIAVHDRKHLARVIRRLRTIKGVLKIQRVFNKEG